MGLTFSPEGCIIIIEKRKKSNEKKKKKIKIIKKRLAQNYQL